MYEVELWAASFLIIMLALLFVGWMVRKLLIIFGMIALPVARQRAQYRAAVASMPSQAKKIRREHARVENASSTLDDPGIENEDSF